MTRGFLLVIFVVAASAGCTDAAAVSTASSGAAQSRGTNVEFKAGTFLYALDTRSGAFNRTIRLEHDTCVTSTRVYGTGNQAAMLISYRDEGNRLWALAPPMMVKLGSEGCRNTFTLPNVQRLMTCPVHHLSDGDRLASAQKSARTWEVIHRLDGYAWAQSDGQSGLVSDACVHPRWPGEPGEITLPDYIEMMNERFLQLNVQIEEAWANVFSVRTDDLDQTSTFVHEYISHSTYDPNCLTCFLEPFHRDPEVVRAMLLNVLSTKDLPRKSGGAYAVHPAALNYYILEVAGTQLGKLEGPGNGLARKDALRQILVLAHTHDVIEELIRQFYVLGRRDDNPWLSLLRENEPTIEGIRQLKDKINQMFLERWRIGDKVVLLMESELRHSVSTKDRVKELAAQWGTTPFVVEQTLFAHMLREANDFHLATVKVADRIDFFMNYDFLFMQPENNRVGTRNQLIGNIARGFWALKYYLNATVDEYYNGLPHRATAQMPGFPQGLLDLAYAAVEHALYDDPRVDRLLQGNRYAPAMTRGDMILQIASTIAELDRVSREQALELSRTIREYLTELGIPEAENFDAHL